MNRFDNIEVKAEAYDALMSLWDYQNIIGYVHITSSVYVERESEDGPLLYVSDNSEFAIDHIEVPKCIAGTVSMPKILLESGRRITMKVVD